VRDGESAEVSRDGIRASRDPIPKSGLAKFKFIGVDEDIQGRAVCYDTLGRP
jgi:hypothetical protein